MSQGAVQQPWSPYGALRLSRLHHRSDAECKSEWWNTHTQLYFTTNVV